MTKWPNWGQTDVYCISDVIQPSHPRPLLLPPSVFPSIRVFSNESVLCIRWPRYWSFSFNISPSNEHSGLISFRNWFPLGWVWAASRNWWWTGKPGMLQSMGLQRVGHTWVTELNWYIMSGLQRIILIFLLSCFFNIKIFLSISVSINLLVQQNSVTYYRNWWMWQKCKKEKENIVLSLCFHQFITSVTLQQSSLLKICSTISIPTWLPKCS